LHQLTKERRVSNWFNHMKKRTRDVRKQQIEKKRGKNREATCYEGGGNFVTPWGMTKRDRY